RVVVEFFAAHQRPVAVDAVVNQVAAAAARVTLGPGAVEHSAGEGRDQLVTTPVAFRLAPDHAAVRLVVAAAGAHGVAPLIEEVVKRPGPLSPAPTVAAAL